MRPTFSNAGLAALSIAVTLTGCTALPHGSAPRANPPQAQAPAAWRAPLPQEAAWPHEGRLGRMLDWWRQQADPVVVEFIEAAQAVSPDIAAARARLVQAQAEVSAAGAALLPQVDATAAAQRRSATPPFPAGTQLQGALQASWELDLFGGLRAQRQAAAWRLEAADAGWHEARVSVAATVALQVMGWRHCQATLDAAQADARSATRSAELGRRLADAGLQAPSQAALTEAAAADSRNRARGQAQRCEAEFNALVALTALSPRTVGERLQNSRTVLQWASPQAVPALPAATLAQRPDVFAAAAAVASAAADVGAQDAQRYPRVGLTGTIGRLGLRSDVFSSTLTTWSIGPLSVSVPVFDAGRRAALSEAARARHAQALAQHEAVVRQAVGEVEDALSALFTTTEQVADAQLALDRARTALRAAQARHREGLASALEVEDGLRRRLAAELNWVDLQRNRSVAWVALYRAAGGGWTAPDRPLTE